MFLLYHAYVYLEFLILACTIYILAPSLFLEKLQNALVEYKKIFDERWQGEKYKWEAVKWFQDHWDINANDFADMFANNCCDWMHGIIHMAVHRLV